MKSCFSLINYLTWSNILSRLKHKAFEKKGGCIYFETKECNARNYIFISRQSYKIDVSVLTNP